jgi:hypothetical protein
MHDHHHHDHSHASDSAPAELTETEKVLKRLHHWVHHNDDHAAGYRDWAERLTAMGHADAAGRLRQAADMTDAISREFEAAADLVREREQSG